MKLRRKIFIIVLVVLQLFFILGTIYWFSTSKIRTLNRYWGFDLPYSVDITDFQVTAAMSEGYTYYVIDLNGYDFKNEEVFDRDYDVNINIQENYDNIIEYNNINDTSEIDWDSDVKWTVLKDGTERLLVIVYDQGKQAVIINEKEIYNEIE